MVASSKQLITAVEQGWAQDVSFSRRTNVSSHLPNISSQFHFGQICQRLGVEKIDLSLFLDLETRPGILVYFVGETITKF